MRTMSSLREVHYTCDFFVVVRAGFRTLNVFVIMELAPVELNLLAKCSNRRRRLAHHRQRFSDFELQMFVRLAQTLLNP